MSLGTARVMVKDVQHTRLAVQNGDVSMEHVVAAIETGLSMESIEVKRVWRLEATACRRWDAWGVILSV